MADNAVFRAMFADPALGLDNESSLELVIVNDVNTMVRLTRIDRKRVRDVANLIRKTVVQGLIGEPDKRTVFSEVTTHNLLMAGTIAKNYARIDRVITPVEIVAMFGDEDQLEMPKA